MADRKVSSISADFVIPTVAGKAKTREVKIKLPHTNKYDVYQKELPANLPDGYDWINSFGIKERKKDSKGAAGKTVDTDDKDPYLTKADEYIIELDDVADKEPVYYYNNAVQPFPTKKTMVAGNRVQVKLALGDPPIGWPK